MSLKRASVTVDCTSIVVGSFGWLATRAVQLATEPALRD
jgi:hypothetical protein